jgi:hypothetical protein
VKLRVQVVLYCARARMCAHVCVCAHLMCAHAVCASQTVRDYSVGMDGLHLANLSRRHGTEWFSAFRYVAVEKLEMAYRLSDYVDFAYVMPQESPNGPIRPFLRK